jgi:hypothetical protein
VFQVRWVEKRTLRHLAGTGNGARANLRARQELVGNMLKEGITIGRAKWSGGLKNGSEFVVGEADWRHAD